MKDRLTITLNYKTIKAVDSIIDNVYVRNRSQAIEQLIERALGENKTAVILAGGDEEGLKISSGEFRPTAKIGNRTVIELSLQKLRESGFREIFVVARHYILRDIFQTIGDGSKYGVKISYTEEEKCYGSADSLRLLKGKIKSSFLVVFADLIFSKTRIKELWDSHIRQKAISTLMIGTLPTNFNKTGVVAIEGNKIVKFIEKPKLSNSSIYFLGLFIAEPEIFEYNGSSLKRDVFPILSEKGFLYSYINSAPFFHFHDKKELNKIEAQLKDII